MSIFIKHEIEQFLINLKFLKCFDTEIPELTLSYKNKIDGNMQKWILFNDFSKYTLYIHQDNQLGHYCNLYFGENENNVIEFKLRNIRSMILKYITLD